MRDYKSLMETDKYFIMVNTLLMDHLDNIPLLGAIEALLNGHWVRMYNCLIRVDRDILSDFEKHVYDKTLLGIKKMRNKEAFIRLRQAIVNFRVKHDKFLGMEKYRKDTQWRLKFVNEFWDETQIEQAIQIKQKRELSGEEGVEFTLDMVVGPTQTVFNEFIRAIAINIKDLEKSLATKDIPAKYVNELIEELKVYFPVEKEIQS